MVQLWFRLSEISSSDAKVLPGIPSEKFQLTQTLKTCIINDVTVNEQRATSGQGDNVTPTTFLRCRSRVTMRHQS